MIQSVGRRISYIVTMNGTTVAERLLKCTLIPIRAEGRMDVNILEHYIVDVKSVEPREDEWTKEFPHHFLKIKATVDCYGSIKEIETVERKEDWAKIKERGYFMR